MNFGIEISETGEGTMTWDKPTNISTNVWWSLNISQGKMFNNISFGLKLDDIKKVTDNNVNLIKQRAEAALAWLLNTGKASSVSVIVERDLQDPNRINFMATVVQADGFPIVVNTFRTIGGPSSSFVYP